MSSRIRAFLTASAACLCALVMHAHANPSSISSTPSIQAHADLSGTIRVWGDPVMRNMLIGWEYGFQKVHPDVRFENHLYGTFTAVAGLDHQVAEIAAMGRDLTVEESMSFEWIYRYKPLRVKVSSGSANVPGALPALAVLVNRANPIQKISVQQLRSIFACCSGREKQSAGDRQALWGDLEATSQWASTPVHPMGYALDKGVSAYFREAVLQNSRQWNCDYRSYPDRSALVRAVAADPGAIAIGTAADANASVKIVALDDENTGDGVLPTPGAIRQQAYSLSRFTYLFVNRGTGHPLEPVVLEFLRYVLSPEGQSEIEQHSKLLALPAALTQEETRSIAQ